ncbi:uncharacterized protein mop isoform X2 [Panulirus ornatus]|uniref:uncharacterized protein mop isoform X2 n=1 Tax=Panulirus ornatus TaxID=150431 RepID=UPI003A8B0A4B
MIVSHSLYIHLFFNLHSLSMTCMMHCAPLTAKVAMQVVDYLKAAMKSLWSGKSSDAVITEIVGSRKLKMWRRYCEFKVAYHGAVALLYQGMQAEEQQKMGERVAYYQAAVETLNEASKIAKNLEQQENEMKQLNRSAQSIREMDSHELIAESLTFSHDVMGGKLTAAEKENEFVYHEKVPPISSLPEVKGASLVKGIPFSVMDPEVAGQDIFMKLVPLEAHQASSMYSEEKAKLLRRVGSAIQEKTEELETYLASMQLDSLALDSETETLPQELIESCADLNASSGVKKLTDIMAKISNFYHDINAALENIKRFLEEEDEKEKEFLAIMGKRAPNMIIGELKREASKYREAHQSAQDNNTALHRAITTHLPNLQLLSKPLDEVAAAIPSVASLEGQGDPMAKQEVKRLLGKVSEMQAQRAKWEAQLRSDIQDDDVTKQLVTSQDDMEEFFKNELKKHDKLVSLLEQNMSAQTNILQALSEANAAYATTRRLTNQVQAQRTETISSLVASYSAYLNILKKAEDAQEFYRKLEGQVNKLGSRVKSVCCVQDEEREKVLSANVKKFSGSSVTPKDPGGVILPGQPSNLDAGANTGGGPKLKDYLQHMKGGGIGVSTGIPTGMITAANQQIHPGAPGYGYSDPSASYAISMRPTPLGSEHSDPLTSCSGQSGGGYTASYSSQASVFQPSAPSPAPSPAPQSAGSPYKTPVTAAPYGTSGQYYGHQGTAAYPATTGVTGYPSTQSSSVPISVVPSVGGVNTTSTPHAASTISSQHSSYTPSQTGSQYPNHYGYNIQYPYYGYHNMTGMTHTTPTLSGSGTSPLSVPQGSPLHGGAAGTHDQGVTHHPPYAHGPRYPSVSEGVTSSSTAAAAQPVASGHTGSTTQGYYGYYQQQQPSTTSTTSIPVTQQSVASTSQISSQPSHPASTQSHSQYPYQHQQAQGSTTVPSTSSQTGSLYTSNYRPDFSSQSGGVVYSSQFGYAHQGGVSYKGQTGSVQASSMYSEQGGSSYPSGSYGSQVSGVYSSGSYSSQPCTTTSAQSSGTLSAASNAAYASQGPSPYVQWNMYSNYPQAGISSNSTSQAGTAPTNTSKSGSGSSVSCVQQYPYNNVPALTTTPSTALSGGSLVSSQVTQPATGSQATSQYSQAVQYNQGYSQSMMWAQYGDQQQYRLQQQKPHHPQQQQQQPPKQPQQPQQHPQQPQQHPQQPQQQSQQPQQHPQQPQPHPQQPQHPQQSLQSSHQYPQQPQPQPPQQPPQQPPLQPKPLQPQNKQGINTQGVSTGSSVSSITSGISNLDLLSGIELTSPPASQWSPLTPQPAGTRQPAEPVNSVGGGSPSTSAQSGAAPDVTSTAAATSNQTAPATGSNLPNVVSSNRKPTVVDPLSDDEKLQKLAVETERLSKVVEGLDRKSLNGPTNLELKWKELVEIVEKECGELKVSVARCYPLKNRFADILPYDHTRVTLPSSRDDYINASHLQLKSVEESFPLILTQAPMPATFVDFWTMVWEQQVEIIVCLNSDAEVKGQVYLPSEVSSSVDYGQFTVILHSCRQAGSPVSYQRVLHVTHRTSKLSRVIIHLQFLGWPPSAMPESPSPLLQFLAEVHTFQRQQRNKLRPIVFHCVPGLGRSGVLTVLSSFIKEIHSSGTLLDITSLVVELSKQRRGGVQDKEHLHFLFSAALYYAQDVLMKRGILTNKATFEEGPREKTHVRHPSADLLSSYNLSQLKTKLGLDQEGGRSGSEGERSRSNSVASLLSNGSSTGGELLKDGQKDIDKDSGTSSGAMSSVGSEAPAPVNSAGGSAFGVDSSSQPDKTSGTLDASFSSLPPSLAASLDPQQFKLDPPSMGKPSKITKESFETPGGALKKSDDPGDPLSGLDPLWSHKKS